MYSDHIKLSSDVIMPDTTVKTTKIITGCETLGFWMTKWLLCVLIPTFNTDMIS